MQLKNDAIIMSNQRSQKYVSILRACCPGLLLKFSIGSACKAKFTGFIFRKHKMILDIIILRFIHHIIALGLFIRTWLHKLRKPIDYKRRHSYRRLCFDSNSLKKIPLHVGLVLSEDDYSYTDIANLIVWSMAIGIPYISVYDLHGKL